LVHVYKYRRKIERPKSLRRHDQWIKESGPIGKTINVGGIGEKRHRQKGVVSCFFGEEFVWTSSERYGRQCQDFVTESARHVKGGKAKALKRQYDAASTWVIHHPRTGTRNLSQKTKRELVIDLELPWYRGR